jgi:hypothetical protein
MPEPAPEPKDRFHCIECSVQVVVGSEAKVLSAEVKWQLEHRLCTACMHKRGRRPQPVSAELAAAYERATDRDQRRSLARRAAALRD